MEGRGGGRSGIISTIGNYNNKAGLICLRQCQPSNIIMGEDFKGERSRHQSQFQSDILNTISIGEKNIIIN